jgi:hypothetical protein
MSYHSAVGRASARSDVVIAPVVFVTIAPIVRLTVLVRTHRFGETCSAPRRLPHQVCRPAAPPHCFGEAAILLRFCFVAGNRLAANDLAAPAETLRLSGTRVA